MTASPTRRQLAFLLGSLLLAPLVTLYATQAVWLQSLWAPLPWMASHGGATVLFWVLFSSLSLTLYGFFRRLFPAYLPEVAVFMGVAVTSRYKLDINGAPLQLSDFAFVGNLGDITGYAAAQLIPTLTTLLAIGVAAVLTETLRRKETWRPSLTQGFVLGSLCLTLFLSALYPGALQSAALRLDQNSPDQETRNERMGPRLRQGAAGPGGDRHRRPRDHPSGGPAAGGRHGARHPRACRRPGHYLCHLRELF